MATIPQISKLNASSSGIINAILNSGIPELQGLPLANNTVESIRQVGEQITAFEPRRNAFLNALVNRIAKVEVTSKMYSNPWAMFKKGMIEYGETIEEIFVGLTKPFQYDPGTAESEIYKRENPDVRAAFHSRNFQKFYKVTIEEQELKKAFLTMDGVTNLVAKIVDMLYSSANYDEFLVMKYMLARLMIDGKIKPIEVLAVNSTNISEIMVEMKSTLDNMSFMSTEYNMAKVRNFSDVEELYLLKTNKFSRYADVEVLANAFNMEKADFLGHQVKIDDFGTMDTERLAEIFEGDPGYVAFTTEELTLLASVIGVVVDEKFLMIYDNELAFKQLENQQGLYWNNWLHTWKTFSASPFAQAALFTTTASTITALTLTPSTLSMAPGTQAQLSYTATRTGFTDIEVTWEIVEETTKSYVTPQGLVVIGADETADTLTVKVTSVVDTDISDTSVITIL